LHPAQYRTTAYRKWYTENTFSHKLVPSSSINRLWALGRSVSVSSITRLSVAFSLASTGAKKMLTRYTALCARTHTHTHTHTKSIILAILVNKRRLRVQGAAATAHTYRDKHDINLNFNFNIAAATTTLHGCMSTRRVFKTTQFVVILVQLSGTHLPRLPTWAFRASTGAFHLPSCPCTNNVSHNGTTEILLVHSTSPFPPHKQHVA
jgi:hypothetical protein